MNNKKIGIGITTRNRPECLRSCLEHFAAFGSGDKLVVIDDNSEDAEATRLIISESTAPIAYKYSPVRLGIAKAKNACLSMLSDCDYVFLFDDDAWPHAYGWADAFIYVNEQNNIGHSMWFLDETPSGEVASSLSKRLGLVSRFGGTHTQMAVTKNALGVALYFSRACLDSVGGYDPTTPHVYGYEHAQMSRRCHMAGFSTGGQYVSPSISARLIYSVDICHNWLGIPPNIPPKWLPTGMLHTFGSSVSVEEASKHTLNNIIMNSPAVNMPLVDPIPDVQPEYFNFELNSTRRPRPKIVAICPANFVSGGPEALHQLIDTVNELSPGMGKICYTPFDASHLKAKEFSSYDTPVIHRDEIQPDDIVVIPEVYPYMLNEFTNRIVFWWLSVDHFVAADPQIANKAWRHAAQSEYARLHVKTLFGRDALMLTDYVHDAFRSPKSKVRIRRVITNPKKGKELAEQFIAENPDIEVIEIAGKQKHELAQIFAESMVYVDFGNHPGKDRMPREASISGCVVLTAAKGAAKNHIDVPIDDKFKFDSVDGLGARIKDIYDNFESNFVSQLQYHNFIRGEKPTFRDEVQTLINHSFEIGDM
jgi:hypothetical protein